MRFINQIYVVKIPLVISLLSLFLIGGCDNSPTSDNNNDQGESKNNWLVPKSQIVDGGPGRGGIPSIDNPKFLRTRDVIFMDSTDLIIGVKIDGKIKGYPHKILNWHEIVNDELGPRKLALTYCPLTGTGICWNRKVKDRTLEFGVSGLIYKNNLIPFDRQTDSHWSQMMNQAIEGKLIHTNIKTFDVIETNWNTWKRAYPDARVLSKNTGFTARYSQYPYGNYRSDHDQFLFPRGFKKDNRLPAKTRVHASIIRSEVKVYPIKKFPKKLQVINDQVNDKKIVVFGSSRLNIAESFGRTLKDGTTLEFESVHDELPIVMKDQEGNRWTIFGKAVKGPRKGSTLPAINSYNGFWFAFVDFFRGVQIHNFL